MTFLLTAQSKTERLSLRGEEDSRTGSSRCW